MKKLLNSSETAIADTLKGLEAATPWINVDHEHRFVYRATRKDPHKVALVSGGGSGHEPMHTGYVGTGMLDAAVAGAMFTSPTPDQILAAIERVSTDAGVLLIVTNYTGDVMNFEMAAEFAEDLGCRVETVVVADDVAVEDSLFTAGRRGVGLTVMMEKLLGAAAEAGVGMDELLDLAQRISDNGRSMGMALTSCTVPSAGKPTFDLPDDDMEIGIGIHGEPGRDRQPVGTAAEIARQLVEPILADRTFTGTCAVMVNGMGATPLHELHIMFAEVSALLANAGITVDRTLVGNYVTSLDMAGVSVTLLSLDADMLEFWDAPALTSGIRWGM